MTSTGSSTSTHRRCGSWNSGIQLNIYLLTPWGGWCSIPATRR